MAVQVMLVKVVYLQLLDLQVLQEHQVQQV
jgi:hypothetical protein